MSKAKRRRQRNRRALFVLGPEAYFQFIQERIRAALARRSTNATPR